jgi:cell division initiation protein
MPITPIDIQQQQFRVRFRGFDIQEVDDFLNSLADEMEILMNAYERLDAEVKRLNKENEEFRKREGTFKKALVNSQKVMEQMKENARQSADIIISNAEMKAEKILNRSHNRQVQIQEDIAALKRQRIQLETEIRTILDAHSKILEMEKKNREAVDEEDSKLKIFNNAK